MSDFATDLFWEEARQPEGPAPAREDRRLAEGRRGRETRPLPVESPSQRLQRVAGNAALAREAEEAEAEAATRRLREAARRTPAAPTPKAEKVRSEPDRPRPKEKPEETRPAPARPTRDRTLAKAAARVPDPAKEAAVRAALLGRAVAAFEDDPGTADLLTLARACETAPPGVADRVARALAAAALRAEPSRRAAIAARVRSTLGDRGDLLLSRLLKDRLAGLAVLPARAPPPAPAPPGGGP